MRVAVPVTKNLLMYRDNPFSAPMYIIYSVDMHDLASIEVTLETTLSNPFQKNAESLMCNCSEEIADNIEHKVAHYAIADTLQGCDYLLVKKHCKNTIRTLKVAGIELYTSPRFITDTKLAVTQFIIGAHFAHNIQHIHYAS